MTEVSEEPWLQCRIPRVNQQGRGRIDAAKGETDKGQIQMEKKLKIITL